MTAKEFIDILEYNLDIPKDHRIFLVYEDNNSDKIKGYIVAHKKYRNRPFNKEIKNYQLLSFDELCDKYKKKVF